MIAEHVLELRQLTAQAKGRYGNASIVNEVDLDVPRGEVLAIVGESGSGKSMTMLCATGLTPPGIHVTGVVRLLGKEVGAMSRAEVRSMRAKHVGFVFQDPLSSLNPLMTVGRQITEAYERINGKSHREARTHAVQLLAQVGIPEPDRRIDSLPYQFSGGMRQRVMIAMALACEPELLIADEATTALDLTTQAQVIALVKQLQAQRNMTVVWITHDLGIVAGMADRVAVMYGGRIVEQAPVDALFESPAHPYTRALMAARPRPDRSRAPLAAIPGAPPTPYALPKGCAFYPRCPVKADSRCEHLLPPLTEINSGHFVRTFCPTERVRLIPRMSEVRTQG